MRRTATLFLVGLMLAVLPASAQIFEPEGLNIPGAYDGFANPPTIDAIRSVNNTAGDVDVDLEVGTRTYKSGVFQAAAIGGDVVPGTYNWLYTSGPSGGFFNNKWGGVTVTMNTVQSYTKEGADNSITLNEGNFYLTRWLDSGYGDTDAIWFELGSAPVTIAAVADNMAIRNNGDDVTISVTLVGDTGISGETVYVRYTTDDFTTSTVVQAFCALPVCTATVPASVPDNADGGESYYVFTSTANPAADGSDADLKTISIANNSGANFALPVELADFTATLSGSTATLAWSTLSETNNSGFSVEQFDGSEFASLGFVAGAGTTLEAQQYTFEAADLAPGTHRFRLKQTDYDGAFSYSSEIEIAVAPDASFGFSNAYPNPSSGSTSLSLSVSAAQDVSVVAYDVLGRAVATLYAGPLGEGESRALTLDTSAMAAGLYFIRASGETFDTTRTVTVSR